jgi:hypothetical protein
MKILTAVLTFAGEAVIWRESDGIIVSISYYNIDGVISRTKSLKSFDFNPGARNGVRSSVTSTAKTPMTNFSR